MINLDTSVLVRAFAMDDPVQSPKASAFLQSLTPEQPGFISLVALTEVTWVLGRYYDFTREQLANLVSALLETSGLQLEAAETVADALHAYRDSRVSFADCLIAYAGTAARCESTVTFDRKAARDIGLRLLR